MNTQDLVQLSADREMQKKHKKRTKKTKAQLQEQVILVLVLQSTLALQTPGQY